MIRSQIQNIRNVARKTGQALVEFALAATLIFLLLAAAIDLGLIFFALQGIHNAAQEGATYGSRWLYEGRVNYPEIFNRTRYEAGERGGVVAVNLLDLNSNGEQDVDPDVNEGLVLVTGDMDPPNNIAGGETLPDGTAVVTRYIELQTASVPDLWNINPAYQGSKDKAIKAAFESAGTLYDQGTSWCADPMVEGQTCYLKVTVRIKYNLFFALAPAFAESVTLSSSYIRPITEDGFAQAGDTEIDPVQEEYPIEGLDPDGDADGDGETNRDECPGYDTVQNIKAACLDKDGDGIPDYLEPGDQANNPDDDGDGIPTYWECYYEFASPLEPIDIICGDTDNDGILDYLDDNDDGDEFKTEDECSYPVGIDDPNLVNYDPRAPVPDPSDSSKTISYCADGDVDGIPDYLDNLNDREGVQETEILTDTFDIEVPEDTNVFVRLLDPRTRPTDGTEFPAEGQEDAELVITEASQTFFEAWAWDDRVGGPSAATNGISITQVHLTLRSPSGGIVRSVSDIETPYCVFGQTGGECKNWENGDFFVAFDDAEEGEYTLTAQASSGSMPSQIMTKRFILDTVNINMTLFRTDQAGTRDQMSTTMTDNIVAVREDAVFDAVSDNFDDTEQVEFRLSSLVGGEIMTVDGVLNDAGDRYCMYSADGSTCDSFPTDMFNGLEPGGYVIQVRAYSQGKWSRWTSREFMIESGDFFVSFFQANPAYIFDGDDSGGVRVDFPDSNEDGVDVPEVYREDQMMIGVEAYTTDDPDTPTPQNGDGIYHVEMEFRNIASQLWFNETVETPEGDPLSGYCPYDVDPDPRGAGAVTNYCETITDEGDGNRSLEGMNPGTYYVLAQASQKLDDDSQGRVSAWETREFRVVDAPFDETIEVVLPTKPTDGDEDDLPLVSNSDGARFGITVYDPNVGSKQSGTTEVTHRVGQVEYVIADSGDSTGNRIFETTFDYENVAQEVFCMADGDESNDIFEAADGVEACPPMKSSAFTEFETESYWFWVRAQSPRGRWSQWFKQEFTVERADIDVMITADNDDETFPTEEIYLNDDTRFRVMAHEPVAAGFEEGSRGNVTNATNGTGVGEVQVRIKRVGGQWLQFDGLTTDANNAWTIDKPTDGSRFYCVFGVDSDDSSKCAPMPELELAPECSDDPCEPGDLSGEDLSDLEHEIANGEYTIEFRANQEGSTDENGWSAWSEETFEIGYAPMDIEIRFYDYPDDDATLNDYNDSHDSTGVYLADHTRVMAWVHDWKVVEALGDEGQTNQENNGVGVEDVQFRLLYEKYDSETDTNGDIERPVTTYYDNNGDDHHDGDQTDDPFCAFDTDEDDTDGDSDEDECNWMEIFVDGSDCSDELCNLGDDDLLRAVRDGRYEVRVRAKAVDGRWSDWDTSDAEVEFQTIAAPIEIIFNQPDETDEVVTLNETDFNAIVRRQGTTTNGTEVDAAQFRIFDPFATTEDFSLGCASPFEAGENRCYHDAKVTTPTSGANSAYCVYGVQGANCKDMTDGNQLADATATMDFDYLSTGVPHTIAAWGKITGGTWSGDPVLATFQIEPADLDVAVTTNYDDVNDTAEQLSLTEEYRITNIESESRFELEATDNDTPGGPISSIEFQLFDTIDEKFVDLPDGTGTAKRLTFDNPTGPVCVFGDKAPDDTDSNENCAPGDATTLLPGLYKLQVRAKGSTGWSEWIEYDVVIQTIEPTTFECGPDRENAFLDPDWTRQDIGTNPDTTAVSAGSLRVDGWVAMCGTNGEISDNENDRGFHYVWQQAPADFKEISAKLTRFNLVDQVTGDPSTPGTWAAAGLMVRSTDAANAARFAVYATGQMGVYSSHRPVTDPENTTTTSKRDHYPSDHYPLVDGDVWLKIKRVDTNRFVAYYSRDNTNWVQMGREPVVKEIDDGNFLIGFFSTSNGTDDVVRAVFTDVQIKGGFTSPSPSPVIQIDCNATEPALPAPWAAVTHEVAANPLVASYGDPEGQGWLAMCGPRDANIWSQNDEMQYAYRPAPDGLTEIRARVDIWNETGDINDTTSDIRPWAKGALMIRKSEADNAPYFGVLVSGSNGISVYKRTNANGSTTNVGRDDFKNDPTNPLVTPGNPVPPNPIWLRIKVGDQTNKFTAYYTRDPEGVDGWTQLETEQILGNVTPPYQIGFGVSGHTSAGSVEPRVLFNNITMMCGATECP